MKLACHLCKRNNILTFVGFGFMSRWKVCAAFRKLKGILITNSNRPKDVVIIVFGMSSSRTGIWWYVLLRSNVGIYVYRADGWCEVVYMRQRVSVQDRHRVRTSVIRTRSPLSELLFRYQMQCATQGLLEDRQSCTKCANSAFTVLSLSGGSRRGRLATGGSLIWMWWKILCFNVLTITAVPWWLSSSPPGYGSMLKWNLSSWHRRFVA